MNDYSYFFSQLSPDSFLSIAFGLVLFVTGTVLYFFDKAKIAYYLFIFIGMSLVGIGFALIPQFLSPWDEQFHAVVAKSLLDNPLKPILFGEKYHWELADWSANHIWLHKQPLFLWQIALSYKIFGVSLLSLRIPSILMHAATVLFILSIAKRYLNQFLAFIVAVLFAFSDFQIGMVSGVIGMDHNDVAFTFYVTSSFWAWINYHESKKMKWIIWIGLFSGGAILCKWLVGLIVYAGWGIILLIKDRKIKRAWTDISLSFLITLMVSVPWQIYCYIHYRKEFLYEMNYNSRHFTQAIEGHAGDAMFHFDSINNLYGDGIFFKILILSGIILLLLMGIIKRNYYFIFASSIFIIIYTFFTLAQTKLVGYTAIVMSIGYIALVFHLSFLTRLKSFLDKFLKPFRLKLLMISVSIFTLFFFFRTERVINQFDLKKSEFYQLREKKTQFVLNVIKKDKNPSQIYFIKDDRRLHISVNTKFYSDAQIFPFPKNNQEPNIGKVIDLNGIGE